MFGFGKGKIEVILEKFNFKPGETIKGKVKVKMNKPTKARQLKVVFAGTKTTSSGMMVGNSSFSVGIGSRNHDKRKTTTEFVHKFEMPLDGEKEYTEGEYDLEILVPADIMQRGSGPGGEVGAALKAVQFLSGNSSRIEWYIQATLDVDKGLDVNKKVQINVG
ncbi:MAG: hypothetical protein COT90_01675 [Candidatus Diapherotrites archaeon CG10_big_fil_rev_8_21_14_0_10_31_34]|nr:MAG: hypothetical protein COT90_01675 [Candidatus Diapherotrites archaeon CG10_big_fil_rev_8_21_14_0_10_31_34]